MPFRLLLPQRRYRQSYAVFAWLYNCWQRVQSRARRAKHALRALFIPQTLPVVSLFAPNVPSERFAPRLRLFSPPSVPPAAFAAVQARRDSVLCPPGLRMPLQQVPKVAWTVRLVTYCNASGTVQPQQCPRGFRAPKRGLLRPRRVRPVTTVLPTACSTSCCVQQATTAHAVDSYLPCLVPLAHYSSQSGQSSPDTCTACPSGEPHILNNA